MQEVKKTIWNVQCANINEESFECNNCYDKFDSIDALSHLQKIHECPLCEDKCLTDEDFNIHINEHIVEIKSMDVEYLKNGHELFVWSLCNFESNNTVSVLRRDEGYTVKYSPPSEGTPKGVGLY